MSGKKNRKAGVNIYTCIMISLFVFAIMCPSNGYSEDLNEALIKAAWSGDIVKVKELLANKGIDVNSRMDKSGWTALILASTEGHCDVVKALLENGADVNAKDVVNNTALMCASMNGHTDAVKLLLANGANVNDQDQYGFTPVIKAATYGRCDTVEVLLDAGADPNVRDNIGECAITRAERGGHKDTVEVLKKAGAK